jgi:thiol-disulfide isomerase/thioredoxin
MSERKGLVRTGLWAVAAVVVAAGAVAIYLSLGAGGNRGDQRCTATLAEAEAIDPFAIGRVAAMRVASRGDFLGDLTFTRADGQPVSIADFAGQTVLLNLWATWCVPCREEMPAIDRLAAEMAGRPLTVIPLHTMDPTAPPERAGEFFAEVGINTLELYRDPSSLVFYELRRRGFTLGLPTTILIDDNSCLLGVMQAPADWASPEAFRLIEAALATDG